MSVPKSAAVLRLIALIAVLLSAVSCRRGEKTPDADGRLVVTAGLPPAAYLARRIGGDRVMIRSMLPEGRTPHDFTPRTPAVRQAARSRIFLTTGQTFERKVAGFLPANTTVCDVTAGIGRLHFTDGAEHHHDHDHHDHDHECSEDGLDPHVWLSAKNAAVMAGNIADALCAADPAGAGTYRRNRDALVAELIELDAEIRRELAPFAGKTFFVYHPAFGYFAADYGLKQRAVELNGREAGAGQLAAIIREARHSGVATIFVQKQFNPGTARALAKEIGGTVEFLDPLASDLPDNLRRIAAALRRGFTGKDR